MPYAEEEQRNRGKCYQERGASIEVMVGEMVYFVMKLFCCGANCVSTKGNK